MVWYQEEEYRKKTALAEMLKGGVIMDVSNVEQAKIAEEAGRADCHPRTLLGQEAALLLGR